MSLGPHGAEDTAGLCFNTGQLPSGLIRCFCRHGVGKIAVSADVGDALTNLVVKDVIENSGVMARGVIILLVHIEELTVTHLLRKQRRVNDAHLNKGVRAELVIKSGESREHRLLLFIADRVVARVIKGERGREKSFLDFTDAVLIHLVVADVIYDIFRALALTTESLCLSRKFLVAVL